MDVMEALVSIVLIVAGIVISQKKKNAKAKKSVWQKIEDALSEQEDVPVRVQQVAFEEDPAKHVKPAPASFPKKERAAVRQSAFETPFESMPSLEGVDPCHDDMFDARDEMVQRTDDAAPSPEGEELLRGVVLAEILGTPKYKTVGKR